MSRSPHMDKESLRFFGETLTKSECYLEYGCGGSTVYASRFRNLKFILSVDTSAEWVRAIREEVLGSSEVQLYLGHIDLGEVGDWGVPKDTTRYKDFWMYSVAPWQKANEQKIFPDLVLIDGRFRVSCFLYSLIAARTGTTIIFDDYFDRPEYFEVENFCPVEKRVGRSAVFKCSKKFDISNIVSCYARYALDIS